MRRTYVSLSRLVAPFNQSYNYTHYLSFLAPHRQHLTLGFPSPLQVKFFVSGQILGPLNNKVNVSLHTILSRLL